MTSLDLIFWLLVALLGGIAWSIEAGLGQRYRNLLASSVLAASGSAVIIMFWVDDKTIYSPLEAQVFDKKKKMKSEGGLKGEDEEEGAAGGRGGGPDGGGGGANRSGSGQANASGKGDADKANGTLDIEQADDRDDGLRIHSRVPFKDCPVCPDLIILPSGVGQFGSAQGEPGRTPDENDATTIPIAQPFAIGRLEISRAEFTAFVNEKRHEITGACDVGKRRGKFNWLKPGFEQDERHPVVCVSWHDVRLYLAWLGERTNRNYRLPSEVEWEYAARAGTQTPYWSGASLGRGEANINKSPDGTTVGGAFKQSPFGLSDVIGNAGEMTATCAQEPEQPNPPPSDVVTCRRIIKGGSWASSVLGGRHAAHGLLIDGKSTNFIGFRVVRDVDERDDDKLLTRAQRRALARAEQEDAEIKAKEAEDADAAKRAAREPPKAKTDPKADPKAKKK